MKARSIISILLFTAVLSPVLSQDVTQPLPPVLDIVTVDQGTGFTILKWLPGGSPDVSLYVIYTFKNNLGTAVDTVRSPSATEYTFTGSAAQYRSEAYVVAAMDSSENISPLSNSLGTIFLSLANDTCNGKIKLIWTSFTNGAHPATNYRIYMKVNDTPPVLYKTVPVATQTLDVTDYLTSTKYCFYVVACNDAVEISSSNMQCVTSGREAAPGWIIPDASLIRSGNAVIHARYDPDTDIDTYSLELYSVTTSGWQQKATGEGINGNVTMTDQKIDTTAIQTYRISAINNCGNIISSSSPIKTIVLSSVVEGTDIRLRWNNPYPDDDGLFSVFRSAGSDYEPIVSGLTDTIWTDDYRSLYTQVSSGKIAYYVTAARHDAPAGITACRSSVTTVSSIENIFVANAFTPNDDGLNDTFAPLLSFTPESYDFRVFSRSGVLLFRTTNPGTPWDGSNSGTPMPAGAYLWHLTVVTPSGITLQRNGTVAILP